MWLLPFFLSTQHLEDQGYHVDARPGHVGVEKPHEGETGGHKERHGLGKVLTVFDKIEEARSKQVGGCSDTRNGVLWSGLRVEDGH